MNKEQLQFFYDEIMGMFGWDDGDTASGVDPLLWAKKQIRDKDAKLAQLRAENERLVNTLNEWGESYKKIINDGGCPDEQHCSCVPALRADISAYEVTVIRLRAELEEAKQAVEEFGDHKSVCCTRFGGNDKPCNCGFDAWWLTAHPEKEQE